MTREEKIQKRKARAHNRRSKRNAKYFNKIRIANSIGFGVPLHAVDSDGRVTGSWPDSDSPTGYTQKCSYDAWGTCQSPCNGDC